MYQFIVAVKESRKEDKQTKTFNDVLLFLIDILFVFGPFLWVGDDDRSSFLNSGEIKINETAFRSTWLTRLTPHSIDLIFVHHPQIWQSREIILRHTLERYASCCLCLNIFCVTVTATTRHEGLTAHNNITFQKLRTNNKRSTSIFDTIVFAKYCLYLLF